MPGFPPLALQHRCLDLNRRMETASTSLGRTTEESGLRYYLSYARSLLFTDPLICFYTAVIATASLVGSFFDSHGRWQHACARAWAWLILKTGGIKVRVEGLEHVPRGETVI